MGNFLVCVLCFLAVQIALGANILFLFSGGNLSHKLSIWPLVTALSERGHNVTFVSSNSKQPKPNPKVTDITPKFMEKHTERVYNVDRFQDRIEGKEVIFSKYESGSLALCNSTMNSQDDPVLTNLIENGQFELVVINSVVGDCSLFLAHHMGAKYVMFDTSTVVPWSYGIFGLPIESSYPDYILRHEYPMGFLERIQMLYYTWSWYTLGENYAENLRRIYTKRFGLTHAPSMFELYRQASLVLVNSHYSVDFPRSLPPMFVMIGGMDCWEPQGFLPKEIKEFMDWAEDGVILISFGSTIEFNTLSPSYISIFFNMMKKFSKIGFIWRWDGPLPENHPENLYAAKWLPQKEILREKSVRALMSHGGKNSMLEATYYGVPVIAMPLFADQDAQAYRIQAQGIGVKVEAAQFSQEMLDGAIWKILRDPTYKRNMLTRSELFRDRPNPTETAISALEFVLRHDDLSPLKPMDLQQSFYVRQHLDVYLIFILFFVGFPYLLIRICRALF